MEPRLWVCVIAWKPWARGSHLSYGEPAFARKGEDTLSLEANLCKHNPKTRPKQGADEQSAQRPPPRPTSLPHLFWAKLQFSHESAIPSATLIHRTSRGQDQIWVICCPQDSRQQDGVQPRVPGSAGLQGPREARSGPRPGHRPP